MIPTPGSSSRSRRRILVLLAVSIALVAGVLFALRDGGPAARRKARRPDIVMVVWDTCRGDRVGVNGYPLDTTPHLARFARRAVTFRRCYTPAPWTAPAHASLFTGLLPAHHGLREGLDDHVRPDIPLLATTLGAAGYETVCISANSYISAISGLNEGFQRELPAYVPGEEEGGRAPTVMDRLQAWIADRPAVDAERRPVFLFLNLMETHLPYEFHAEAVAELHGDAAVAPARTAAREVDDMAAKLHLIGERRVPPETIEALSLAYDGAVRTVDARTADLFDILRAAGLLDEALVAVAGDHGDHLGENGMLYHALSVHDAVLHVPLVVRWPGHLDDGSTVDTQVQLQDLYPTILEAAGVPKPSRCGRDAVTLVKAPTARTLVAEFGPLPRTREQVRGLFPDLPLATLDRFLYVYRGVRESRPDGAGIKYVAIHRWGGTEPGDLLREALLDLGGPAGESVDLLRGTPSAETLERAGELREAGRTAVAPLRTPKARPPR